jgi:hypothetical protein
MAKKDLHEATGVASGEHAAIAAESTENAQSSEKVFTIPPAPVTLEQAAAKYENLKSLFARKAAFKHSLGRLETVMDELGKSNDALETETVRLAFSVGRYNQDNALKISNKQVIIEAVDFLKQKIDAALISVEAEILSNY